MTCLPAFIDLALVRRQTSRLRQRLSDTIIRYYLVFGEKIMAKNTSITLGEHFEGFIATQIQSGRYGSASEVIRSALRLLETQETKMNTLRQLLVEGENSGNADYDLDTFINELDSEERK